MTSCCSFDWCLYLARSSLMMDMFVGRCTVKRLCLKSPPSHWLTTARGSRLPNGLRGACLPSLWCGAQVMVALGISLFACC
jgi:hypothetical protein